MAFAYFDRVKESSTTTGTGDISLAGAASGGFRAFGAVYSNGDTMYYCIADQSGNEWEVGLGIYNSSGNTLTRSVVHASSNSNAAVNFTSGSLYVFTTIPAAIMPSVSTAFAASATTDTTNASNISSGTLAAARGGAGTANGILKANGSGTVSAATSGTDYSAGTSALATGILKSTTSTGALTIASAGDFPTLNQNTTGSAASLSISGQTGLLTVTGLASTNRTKTVRDAADTILELGGNYTPTGTWNWASATVTWPTFNQNTTGSAATLTTARAVYGNNFNGSAALTQIIASTYGGTGNGFTKFSGAATTEKTYTLPNATCTILTDNAVVTGAQGGTGVNNSGKTITLANNLTTSGNFALTLTQTGTTNVTLPTTGTLATLAGSESLTNKKLGSLTSNGFVKTSGGDGTLSVDTASYQPLDSDLTTIAGLTATTDNFLQAKASAWASRTPTQVTADLIAFVGDAGSGGTKGLVPAPATGDASKYLKGDGTWGAPAGSGTVTTTGTPANGNLAKFSGSTSVTNADLTGDVTTSGTVATTIANDAVTYAKMQNVSAASKLLGRGDSGSGDPQEITLGSGLSMSGTTLSASGGGGGSAILNMAYALSTLSASATTYFCLGGGTVAASTTEAARQTAVPRSGTVRDLHIVTGNSQHASGNLVFTLRKNGSDTSLVATVTAGSAAGVYSDTSNTVSVAAGDLLTLKAANGASATSAQLISAAVAIS